MILIVGGGSQGKKAFAEQLLGNGSPVRWTDGARADWETFMKGQYCCNFHLLIRRVMSGAAGFPGSGALCGPGSERQLEEYVAAALVKGNPDRILVTDEIGYGIVPIDGFERRYREETGRICCLAAKEAAQVWRVCCGIGQRIK